jgi:hypothetical protein
MLYIKQERIASKGGCSMGGSNLLESEQEECSRETREGWSLLTDETEENGDAKSTNERDQ